MSLHPSMSTLYKLLESRPERCEHTLNLDDIVTLAPSKARQCPGMPVYAVITDIYPTATSPVYECEFTNSDILFLTYSELVLHEPRLNRAQVKARIRKNLRDHII